MSLLLWAPLLSAYDSQSQGFVGWSDPDAWHVQLELEHFLTLHLRSRKFPSPAAYMETVRVLGRLVDQIRSGSATPTFEQVHTAQYGIILHSAVYRRYTRLGQTPTEVCPGEELTKKQKGDCGLWLDVEPAACTCLPGQRSSVCRVV